MKQQYQILTLCAAALTLLATGRAQAQGPNPFTITFSPDTMSGNPNDFVSYSATLANTSATDYYVTGATFNSNSPNANLLQGFFNGNGVGNGAFEVLGGSSQTISDVFALQLDQNQPNGTYNGIATFTGQTASNYPNGSDVELGNGALTLNVPAAVPEASTSVGFGLLLTVGGVCVACRRRKERRS